MTFWAKTADGDEMLLGEAVSVELLRDENAPADLLKVRFPADSVWQELAKVFVYHEGEIIFSGVVDEQITRFDPKGLEIELICRSMAAILLDNEAKPMVLQNVSWQVLSARYGCGLENSGLNPAKLPAMRGKFEVKKGESCWQVLERFAHDILNMQLTVDEKEQLVLGKTKTETIMPSEILSVKMSYLPYKRISRVWVQDVSGAYRVGYENPNAKAIFRERYLAKDSVQSPIVRVLEAEKAAHQWHAVCKGLVNVRIGDTAEIPFIQGKNKGAGVVTKVKYTLDSSGLRTTLQLREGEKVCG